MLLRLILEFRGFEPEPSRLGDLPVVPRPEELWGLLNTPAEDDSGSGSGLSDNAPDKGDDAKDLFKSV